MKNNVHGKDCKLIKVFFASSSCDRETYGKVFFMRNDRQIDPEQKFFEQIITGISKTDLVSVTAITSLPVSASTSSQKIFHKNVKNIGDITYVYPGFINGKFLRYMTVFISGFFTAIHFFYKARNQKRKVVLCDPLCLQISKAVRWAAKIFGIRSIAIVTDIPIYATEMKQHKFTAIRFKLQHFYERMTMKEVIHYDAYIILTESMNPYVNPKGKPAMVMEGSVDSTISLAGNHISLVSTRIIIYAGGVYEKFGVKKLVKAFLISGISDAELHIYGNGSYVDELLHVCKNEKRIKYRGVALNTEMPNIESNAFLLVNPRPSDEVYTQFSFPSKILEYMSSGKPVLTTRLAGIPKEYEPYLLWFDDESIEGMANTIRSVMQMEPLNLSRLGRKAQTFVMEKKSNIVQSKKIMLFASDNLQY